MGFQLNAKAQKAPSSAEVSADRPGANQRAVPGAKKTKKVVDANGTSWDIPRTHGHN